MEILHTTNEEPFVSGTGHFAGWENRLMKLEDTAILFCREGHAHIMIDLQEYELAPNTQVVLLPDTIVNFTNISPDFTISYIAFSRILFQEVTARLDLSFWLSGNFWLLSFKISYLCLPLFYETRTTPSCHPSGCAYRQL